jgi:hypothetical protein
VGAPYATGAGEAFVFRHDGSVWEQEQVLAPPDGGNGGVFGLSVAIDGDLILVGASGGNPSDSSRAVYVFERRQGNWESIGRLGTEAGPGSGYGFPVALRGGTAVIGARFEDDVGAAYLYDVRRPCQGDLNGDGLVDAGDLVRLLETWGPCPAPPEFCPGDLDGDGQVSIADLLALLAFWS